MYSSYLSPGYLVLPVLLPCYFLDYLGWQLLNQPFLVYVFSSFSPSLPRFSHSVYNSCAVSCASSPLLRPPQFRPRSRRRFHRRYCSRFRLRSRPPSNPKLVHGSPPPFPFPFLPRTRSRPRSHLALLPSPPPPFSLLSPLRPRPHHRSRPSSRPRPRFYIRSRPLLRSRPRPRSLLPVPRTRLPPQCDARVQAPGLANEAVGCP